MFLHFVYGLALFSLGLAVWLETFRPIIPEIKPAWRKLAAFGLWAAVHHWIHTWALVAPRSISTLPIAFGIDVLTLTLSLVYLAMFGAMLISDRKVIVYGWPAILLLTWAIVSWATTSTSMTAVDRHDWMLNLDKFLILIPASLVTAWGFARGRALAGEADKSVRFDKMALAALFTADAVFSGVFVEPTSFFSADRLMNVQIFQVLPELSILVIRSSITIAIAVLVIRLQRVFEEAFIQDRLAKESMEYDARLAADIQKQLIPADPLIGTGVHIHALLLPSRIVGGDIYDYRLTENEAWFVIGDTVGKGAPASVLSIAALIALDSAEASHDSALVGPEDLLKKVNELLEKRFPHGTFMTMSIGRYSEAARALELASAGHLPPFLYRAATRRWELVEIGGSYPLGIFAESQPSRLSIELNPGDRVLLYTDGLIDAYIGGGKRLGENGALEWLNGQLKTDPGELLDQLGDYILGHTRGQLADDVAALLLEVR